ncbi:MAG: hypothetical protein IKT29_06270 [Flavobacteriales bacterium]|nr:hypothetical protein [Flavobacteriales bacterium]
MEVRVTIGVYGDLKGVRIYKINLPAIPQVGDTIILTGALKSEEARLIKEWGLKSPINLNYVRVIAYDDSPVPIVMLSVHPSLLFMDCYKGRDFMFSYCSRVVPRVGESVMDKDGKVYYVENIIYEGVNIMLVLSDAVPAQNVYVINSELDVNISGTSCQVDVAVDDRHPIDVNVTNGSLSVDVNDRY